MRTLIIGGVRSGKSGFAEELVGQRAAKGKKHYLATSVPFDDEMRQRILRHQEQRGDEWLTFEVPYVLRHDRDQGQHALLECLTVFVNNILYTQGADRAYEAVVEELEWVMMRYPHLTIVSNDLFRGYYPVYGEETMEYLKLLSKVHVYLADRMDQVVEIAYGQPVYRKGGK